MKSTETIRVRYIGSRPVWRDKPSLHNSGLTFEAGQVREVPVKLGKSLLRHQDLFERASNAGRPAKALAADDTAELLDAAKREQQLRDDQVNQRLDLFARINQMERPALMDFAKINYRQSLKVTDSAEVMREHVRELVDRFGVVGGF
jgi:DNA-binding ferritin-like protein